jgi:hypothetical protein
MSSSGTSAQMTGLAIVPAANAVMSGAVLLRSANEDAKTAAAEKSTAALFTDFLTLHIIKFLRFKFVSL